MQRPGVSTFNLLFGKNQTLIANPISRAKLLHITSHCHSAEDQTSKMTIPRGNRRERGGRLLRLRPVLLFTWKARDSNDKEGEAMAGIP
jgi:hypothetical protein